MPLTVPPSNGGCLQTFADPKMQLFSQRLFLTRRWPVYPPNPAANALLYKPFIPSLGAAPDPLLCVPAAARSPNIRSSRTEVLRCNSANHLLLYPGEVLLR